MHKGIFGIALGLLLSASALADVLSLPESQPAPQVKIPAKGITMAEMAKQYGEPRRKQPTVGGTAPRQPPITRWDYESFSVIFERDRVVDVVVPGAPPKIYDKNKLEPVPVAAAPAAAAAPPMDAAPPAPVDATIPPTPAEPPAEKLSPEVHEAPAPAK
jgi:hypothetical protein